MALGLAYGDALGARYEGLRVKVKPSSVRFGRGVLLWRRPGWWTDDTDMALGVLRVLARTPGVDLRAARTQQAVLDEWTSWNARANPLDAGLNTFRVLRAARRRGGALADALEVSRAQLEHPRRGGGNGAVMRTAVVALAHPDPEDAFRAGASLAELTHPQPLAMEAAGLWSALCAQALSTGGVEPKELLDLVADPQTWRPRLLAPREPGRNGGRGWAPTTVADAIWCVKRAQEEGAAGALDRGVRLAASYPQDPDTTAAVAGSLLGALTGTDVLALPGAERVHGGRWSGAELTLLDLAALARGVRPHGREGA
jgi:ADP-ribosylglycohydrolase